MTIIICKTLYRLKKSNPYSNSKLFEKMIYDKCWIDTIQWYLEDIIRKPDISPKEALQIKRKIDSSNQDRTDFVEELDDYFFKNFQIPHHQMMQF